jgi:hypothetical protein
MRVSRTKEFIMHMSIASDYRHIKQDWGKINGYT